MDYYLDKMFECIFELQNPEEAEVTVNNRPATPEEQLMTTVSNIAYYGGVIRGLWEDIYWDEDVHVQFAKNPEEIREKIKYHNEQVNKLLRSVYYRCQDSNDVDLEALNRARKYPKTAADQIVSDSMSLFPYKVEKDESYDMKELAKQYMDLFK